MKKYVMICCVIFFTAQIKAQSPTTDSIPEKEIKSKIAQISFVYPLGSSWVTTSQFKYHLSFNLIGGYTGAVQGIELASVYNINRHYVKGVQFSGGFNLTGTSKEIMGYSRNVQFAAGFNYTRHGQSTQFAGGANIADTGCFQGSAGFNLAQKAHAQITAGINLAKTAGFQAAGGVNIAQESYCQFAGGVNVTKKGKAQFAGGVNIASESKCQIAGGVNITGKGKFQMGVINIRDTADGVPLGLINIVKKGGVLDIGIEGSEFIQTALTFRTGIKPLYTIFSGGYNYKDRFWAAGAGLGSSFLWKNRFGLNLELLHYSLLGKQFREYFSDDRYYNVGYNALVQFRPVFHLRIVNHFNIFLGPTFNCLIQTSEMNHFPISAPYNIVSYANERVNVAGWIGIIGGFRF